MSCPDAPLLGRRLQACGQCASGVLSPLARDQGPVPSQARLSAPPYLPFLCPPPDPDSARALASSASFFTLTFLSPHLEVGSKLLCPQNCPILFFTGYDGLLVNTVTFLQGTVTAMHIKRLFGRRLLAVQLGLCASTAGGTRVTLGSGS